MQKSDIGKQGENCRISRTITKNLVKAQMDYNPKMLLYRPSF